MKGTTWSISSSVVALAIGLVACLTFAQERGRGSSDDAAEMRSAPVSANRIVRTLNQPVTVDYSDISLREALDKIKESYSMPIWIDVNGLNEEEISLDLMVQLKLKDVRLRKVLQLLLEPLNLTYVIADGVLKIMTNDAASDQVFTRVYPIGDLLTSDNDQQESMNLMRAIQQSTPAKWMDNRGEGGTVAPVLGGRALVIRQTQKLHRTIDGMLTAIRKVDHLPRLASIPTDPDDVDDLSFETTEVQPSDSGRVLPPRSR